MDSFIFDKYCTKLCEIERKNRPNELFKGDFSLLEKERIISIFGSRKVSESEIRGTRKITKFLVQNNMIVVVGLPKVLVP